MAERLQRRRRFFVPGTVNAAPGKRAEAAKPPIDPPEGATVGRELRAAREKMRWTLEDLETSLKIRFSVLQAIEDSRFDLLPGSTYAMGFVRAYARFLHLDAEDMVRRYKAEAGAFGGPARLSFPSPEYESRLPRDIVIIISIVVAGLAYGGWYYTTASERAPIPRVAAVPEQLAALASRPPESSPSQAEAASVQGRFVAPEPEQAPPPVTFAEPSASLGAPAQVVQPQTMIVAPAPSALPPVAAVEVPERRTVPPVAVNNTPRRPVAAAPAPVPPPAPVQVTPPAQRIAPQPQVAVAPPAPPVTQPQPPVPSATIVAQAPRTAAPAAGSAPPPPPSLVFGGQGANVAAVPPPAAAVSAAPRQAEPAPEAPRLTLTPPPARAPADNGESRIVIRATAEVWVEVRDQAGAPVFMKLMRRGDSFNVPNRGGLVMSAGKAAAIAMTVDGEPVEVSRRSVALEPEQLKRR